LFFLPFGGSLPRFSVCPPGGVPPVLLFFLSFSFRSFPPNHFLYSGPRYYWGVAFPRPCSRVPHPASVLHEISVALLPDTFLFSAVVAPVHDSTLSLPKSPGAGVISFGAPVVSPYSYPPDFFPPHFPAHPPGHSLAPGLQGSLRPTARMCPPATPLAATTIRQKFLHRFCLLPHFCICFVLRRSPLVTFSRPIRRVGMFASWALQTPSVWNVL